MTNSCKNYKCTFQKINLKVLHRNFLSSQTFQQCFKSLLEDITCYAFQNIIQFHGNNAQSILSLLSIAQ